jgi:hypothetical protein
MFNKTYILLLSQGTPVHLSVSVIILGGDRGKFPTTPPPCKKHLTGLQQPADVYPLTKSKSHESQLANRVEGADNLSK